MKNDDIKKNLSAIILQEHQKPQYNQSQQVTFMASIT